MRYLSANQFEVYEEIGRGGFGIVYRGLDRVTKEQVAIKLIDLEDKDHIEDFQKEICILSQCHLDQITRYHGCFVKGYKLWIIMEYVDGGSCHDLLKPGPIKEKYIAILLRELLTALNYLHHNSRIHRDVKSANILLNSYGEVKVADFGVSAQLSNNLSKRNTFVGSPYWMAPEIILEEEYNFKADIWSLGITAIELAKGKPPLSTVPPMRALFQIPKNGPPQLADDEFSKDFKEFVSMCLQKNPSRRPSAKKLLESRFILKAGKTSQLVDLIQRHDIWVFQNQDQIQKERTTKLYSPTLKTDSAHQPISFDFEDSFFAPEASDVIITKHSPLRENRNIQNTLDHNTLKKHSSNLNTLKSKNETQLSPVREEFEQVFTKTSWKTTTDEDELEKLDQVRQIFESLKDNTLATFCREFGNNIQGSSLSKRDFRPKRTEAERLILKRWTDNYFH